MNQLKQNLLQLNIVIDNEYLDLYINIIEKNKSRVAEKYKTQRHHIIPKYYYTSENLPINNTANNIVNVLYKDHILLHYYLFLCSSNNYFKFSNLSAVKHLVGARYHSKIEGQELLNQLPSMQELYEFNRENFKQQVNMKDINKGKVWINNGLISKRVYVSEVESWIAKGYTKGFLRKYGDKKWINNGKLQKVVDIEVLEDYKKLGWKLGKLPLSEEEKKKIIRHPSHLATTKDRIAITNGKINKFVRKEDLDSFLISGEWRKGLTVKPFERTYIDDSFRQKTSQNHKNRIWINNGEINYKIYKKDLEIYLNQGFKCGRYVKDHSIFKNKTDPKWITKDGKNKRVAENQIDAYIKLGWKPGRDTSKIIEKRLENNAARKTI